MRSSLQLVQQCTISVWKVVKKMCTQTLISTLKLQQGEDFLFVQLCVVRDDGMNSQMKDNHRISLLTTFCRLHSPTVYNRLEEFSDFQLTGLHRYAFFNDRRTRDFWVMKGEKSFVMCVPMGRRKGNCRGFPCQKVHFLFLCDCFFGLRRRSRQYVFPSSPFGSHESLMYNSPSQLPSPPTQSVLEATVV